MPQSSRVTVTTALVRVASFPRLRPIPEMAVEIANDGATALNGCQIRLRSETMKTSYAIAATSANFADTALIGCINPDGTTGDPTVLGAGASVMCTVPLQSNEIVEVWASVASGVTILNIVAQT